ncbi:MAG: hypothetical protein JKY55_18505 [Aliivibrio sp.]|uniref:dual OB domain-containing protein n=1 Tax=Aliivibrio sp. TaxID=1872443 RepID=UPI001A3DED88|nr:hypothetical protein [Aliivibrio sp.]
MTKLIVTDLTRFSTRDKVCIAGIDIDTGECIRPMPYIKYETCEKVGLIPGAIIEGTFKKTPHTEAPHTEDMYYSNLKYIKSCSKNEFYDVLSESAFDSVEKGFDIKLQPKQKHLPAGHDINHSIITLSIRPSSVEISENKFKKGKINISFCDNTGKWLNNLSITDLGFHDYAMEKHGLNKLDEINEFINDQEEVFIRLGIGRKFQPKSQPDGYWLQVNGIYTFPNYFEEIRVYK